MLREGERGRKGCDISEIQRWERDWPEGRTRARAVRGAGAMIWDGTVVAKRIAQYKPLQEDVICAAKHTRA